MPCNRQYLSSKLFNHVNMNVSFVMKNNDFVYLLSKMYFLDTCMGSRLIKSY